MQLLIIQAPTPTSGKVSESEFYKGEYRKLKGENEDIKLHCEQLSAAIEVRVVIQTILHNSQSSDVFRSN